MYLFGPRQGKFQHYFGLVHEWGENKSEDHVMQNGKQPIQERVFISSENVFQLKSNHLFRGHHGVIVLSKSASQFWCSCPLQRHAFIGAVKPRNGQWVWMREQMVLFLYMHPECEGFTHFDFDVSVSRYTWSEFNNNFFFSIWLAGAPLLSLSPKYPWHRFQLSGDLNKWYIK